MPNPILYVKRGCSHCEAAIDYLDQHQIAYEKVDVRGNDALMKKLHALSGQTKTPTLDWDGKVLVDFGTDELEIFLRDRAQVS